MRVILMQKVERLGEPGQQVEVADGYARNFLLPKRLAVPATAGNVKSLSQLKAQTKNREDRFRLEAKGLAEKLAAVHIVLKRRAGEESVPSAERMVPSPGVMAPSPGVMVPAPAPAPGELAPAPGESPPPGEAPAGRLFGSVTGQDISQALAALGLAVDKRKVLLAEPIKTLGVHRVPVRLHADVTAEVALTVEREA
ncbi:MAG TPA: 50S ribosomal protein L9 [Candidatus Methylomirabilis sp.]